MSVEANQAIDPPIEAPKRVKARELLGPKGIAQIEHEGELYTLRITKNNRLILTK
ncbi:MAG: hemin uptake protein HemP [Myxococcota bacterium]